MAVLTDDWPHDPLEDDALAVEAWWFASAPEYGWVMVAVPGFDRHGHWGLVPCLLIAKGDTPPPRPAHVRAAQAYLAQKYPRKDT